MASDLSTFAVLFGCPLPETLNLREGASDRAGLLDLWEEEPPVRIRQGLDLVALTSPPAPLLGFWLATEPPRASRPFLGMIALRHKSISMSDILGTHKGKSARMIWPEVERLAKGLGARLRKPQLWFVPTPA